MVGECSDMRLIDPREAVRVAREHKTWCWASRCASASRRAAPRIMPLDIALDVAEEVGLR